MRLTALAHSLTLPHLRPGDLAVDATAGNGHDTLALARAVGESGQVWAFDIQTAALDATRARLAKAGAPPCVTPVHASHATMREHLPAAAHGRLGAVMANLGYLPGGDPAVITDPAATAAMLKASAALLRRGGVLTVTAYPGHAGGDDDARAAYDFFQDIAATTGAPAAYHGEPLAAHRRPWLALWRKP